MKVAYWLRKRFKSWAARFTTVIEFCDLCGIRQPVVWYADDALWQKVTGREPGGGIFCPRCFDAMASERGILVYWTAATEFRDSTYNERRAKTYKLGRKV